MADVFRNRKTNTRRTQPTGGGEMKLRYVPAKDNESPRLVIRCGCCDFEVEVRYDDGALVINGFLASVAEWCEMAGATRTGKPREGRKPRR